MNTPINEINKRSKDRSFYFYIDDEGSPTLDSHGEKSKNPELFIEQRTNQELTKVHIERMSETHPFINNALNFLLTLNKDFEKAQLRFDNNPKITINEFLESKNNNINILPEKLYHGTSLKSALKILKEGIKPREETGQEAKYKSNQTEDSHLNKVYLCGINTIGPAKFAARQAAILDDSKPVVLVVNSSSLDIELLRPDEDSQSNTWEGSMHSLGSLSYEGTINESAVKIDKAITKSFNPENECSFSM
jgi:hypothetical protein